MIRQLALLCLLNSSLLAAEPAPHIRIVLAGDSTVTDKSGWGPGFKSCLATNIECINKALGGRSSKSFIKEGHWTNCLALKPDYMLIQFGHNDQPGHPGDRETDIKTEYPGYMNRYVDDCRAAGIKPVFVTSLSRRQWGSDGKIHSTLEDRAEVVKTIAAEKHVPLIDLHARSVELYNRLGSDGLKDLEPVKVEAESTNTGAARKVGIDHTHLTPAGSRMIGPIVAEELAKVVPSLAPYIHVSADVPSADLVVAADGSGNFTSVQAAVDAAPANSARPFVIFLKPGTYKGHVLVPPDKPFLVFRGLDAANTIITDDKNVFATDAQGEKLGTPASSTVLVRADNFTAENVTFENTAGNHGQALAMYITGDRGVFRHCRFLGWQDTLRADSPRGGVSRQYFEDCNIVGHVDFIYAAGTAVFNRCHIHCVANGYITAASTARRTPFGYVFFGCRITVDPAVTGTYLGRPWRPYAKVVFLNTEMPSEIRPEGWHNWGNVTNEITAYYAEYKSTGPGARPETRVKWSYQLTDEEARAYTVQNVLKGRDGWNPETR